MRKLSTTGLKLTAVLTMTLDHVGYAFFPEVMLLRFFGRLAMPLMAFVMAEGYAHTQNKKKYAARLFAFALISQLPYYFALGLKQGNVLFTLLISFLLLWVCEAGVRLSLKALAVLVLCLLSFFCDWTIFCPMFVSAFYIFREKPIKQAAAFSVVGLILLAAMYINHGYLDCYAVGIFLMLPFLFLYDGRRGRGLKWFFYAYYPAHLALIAIILRLPL